ncbi:hypothetical protein E2C01_070717 [Portunus trituberculatus]|uniref:Secreted protein n=1 Tax=Portunus trituberculatus TaxID=210409 RepID=A0A5B7I491_PORTR|nr:hypothetical protein [Portunus trituberculatus]
MNPGASMPFGGVIGLGLAVAVAVAVDGVASLHSPNELTLCLASPPLPVPVTVPFTAPHLAPILSTSSHLPTPHLD